MSVSVIAYVVNRHCILVATPRLLPAFPLVRQAGLLGGMGTIALLLVQLGECAVNGGPAFVQRETTQVSRDGFAPIALGCIGAAEFQVDVRLLLLVIRRGGKCLARGQRKVQRVQGLAAQSLSIEELREIQVGLRALRSEERRVGERV